MKIYAIVKFTDIFSRTR